MPIRNLLIIWFTALISGICYLKADRNQYAAVIADAMHKVRLYSLEDIDARQLFEDAMSGMVEGLDQYSAYIGPDAFREMEEELEQEFGGVGIEIEKADETTPLLVLSPLVDTPAYRAGLRMGDEIMEIDGKSTIGMSRKDAVSLMRGAPGSEVRLGVRHKGDTAQFHVTITREIIGIQSVLGDSRRENGSWDYHLTDDPRIAYLRITTFGKRTVDELEQVLTAAENSGVEALLLDLRGNAGGLLSSAVETCDLFISEGRIVSTRGRDGTVRRTDDATADTLVPPRIPIAILVNRYSASASEIVAACLQDHGRAVIVGERTWGKGTVQNVIELEGGRSALKLTTSSYWRPSGRNIHRREGEGEDAAWGVRPNDGFTVRLDDKELENLLIDRRRRDLYHESSDGANGSAGVADSAGEAPVRDRQRDQAWEYLRSRLDEQAQPSAA